MGLSSLKSQLFQSQNLHPLYKSPSHTTIDAHFSWASLFKAPYGAPLTTPIMFHVEMVSNFVSSSLTHLAFCVRAGRLTPLLSTATGSSPTRSSPAKLWSFATKYYHIPAQWRRVFGQTLCQLRYSVHGRQTARAPGGFFFPLWSYKIKNYMRVEQLSWHTYSNLQPTSISSEKHSYYCAALQPCRAPLLKATVMAGANGAVAGR